MTTRKGLWIDDPSSLVLTAHYWDEFKRHEFTTAAIMLEGVGNGFNPAYTVADLTAIRGLAFSRDCELVLTVWPEPSKHYLDQLEAEIPQFIAASGCVALEFDGEGNWTPGKVSGFASLHQASDYLGAIMDRLRKKHDIRIEFTTFAAHVENSAHADLATHADRLLPQAYSVADRATGPVSWDDRLGPGHMQQFTLDLAKQVHGVHKLCCGLAAYDQTFAGHTPAQAMQKAWDMAVSYGVADVRFWSSKHVFGIQKNVYSSAFILSLKGK